jgi:hypothetical protein
MGEMMSAADDDGYGRHWDYRVFSQMWTEPDVAETGKRCLTVHLVIWASRRQPCDYPLPDDIDDIKFEPASPEGIGLEATLLDYERIGKAFDKPTLIKAEWQEFFDHSEQEHRRNEREREERRKAQSKEPD